jgi:hypothetical protein
VPGQSTLSTHRTADSHPDPYFMGFFERLNPLLRVRVLVLAIGVIVELDAGNTELDETP